MQIDLLHDGILMEFGDGIKKSPIFLGAIADLSEMVSYFELQLFFLFHAIASYASVIPLS